MTSNQLKYKKERTIKTIFKSAPTLFKESFLEFTKEKGLFHGAALAYYTLFAIVPLFYLMIAYISKLVGKKVILSVIADVLTHQIGIQDISGIMEFLNQFDFEKTNFFLELVSLIALLLACSAFVVSLKQSINEFYDLKPEYKNNKHLIISTILFRLFSLLILLCLTIILVFTYFAETFILSTSHILFDDFKVLQQLVSSVFGHLFSIASNAVIFAFIFKYVNDGKVAWKLAFIGATLTAILLYIGQLLIRYYLFNFFFAASGGLTGSLFIILAWVYYSSQIIFFGAKFTAVVGKHLGLPIVSRIRNT